MTNYRECSGLVRTTGGDVLPIEDVETFSFDLMSDSEAFDVKLLNVALFPQLNHNLSSLQQHTATY